MKDIVEILGDLAFRNEIRDRHGSGRALAIGADDEQAPARRRLFGDHDLAEHVEPQGPWQHAPFRSSPSRPHLKHILRRLLTGVCVLQRREIAASRPISCMPIG
ncbi:MAG: hypothetical protein ABI593_17475, partial [Betaproteobacteria bacterium]